MNEKDERFYGRRYIQAAASCPQPDELEAVCLGPAPAEARGMAQLLADFDARSGDQVDD